MNIKRILEIVVLAVAAVVALSQSHVNGLTVLACVMVAAVAAVEYRYTLHIRSGPVTGRR